MMLNPAIPSALFAIYQVTVCQRAYGVMQSLYNKRLFLGVQHVTFCSMAPSSIGRSQKQMARAHAKQASLSMASTLQDLRSACSVAIQSITGSPKPHMKGCSTPPWWPTDVQWGKRRSCMTKVELCQILRAMHEEGILPASLKDIFSIEKTAALAAKQYLASQ